jgi:hypothetical protein
LKSIDASGLFDNHFAVSAVEFKSKSLAIVKKEKWTAVFTSVMFRANAEFVPDTISATH